MLLYGDYDFSIGFAHSGGMKAVERVLRWGGAKKLSCNSLVQSLITKCFK